MRRYITDPQSQKQEEVIMYVENKNVPLTDLGGGVVRKVLAYSENLMNVELKFEKGAIGAKHSHPHEQIGYIISGSLLFQEETATM